MLRRWLGSISSLAMVIGCAACLEQPTDLKPSVELFLTTQGEVQEQALRTLVASGRAALPPLEAALHRTEPKERRAALLALRRLGLHEAVPLLGHVAQFDADASIRADARAVLERWAAEKSPRGEAAQRALFAAAAGETGDSLR
ncbi:MAG: hypothetical protein JNM40_03535 [Myxococcales bacterium]|nr:hypothetical protein [Myxococcales bacterium]